MTHLDRQIKRFDFKNLIINMGFLMTSLIAVILTVAGLLTSQNWSPDKTIFKENQHKPHRPSLSPILLQLKPSYGPYRRRSDSISRVARYDGYFDGYGYGAVEKSDFYYILPILLVIGLGSFLIPIISTFFTAMVTSSGAIGGIGGLGGIGCCGRRKRRNMNAVNTLYDIWDTVDKAIDKLTNSFDKK